MFLYTKPTEKKKYSVCAVSSPVHTPPVRSTRPKFTFRIMNKQEMTFAHAIGN